MNHQSLKMAFVAENVAARCRDVRIDVANNPVPEVQTSGNHLRHNMWKQYANVITTILTEPSSEKGSNMTDPSRSAQKGPLCL